MRFLRGRALAWAGEVNASNSVGTPTNGDFVTKFRAVFEHTDYHGNASICLSSPWLGSGSVADYTVDFRVLAVDSQRNDEALRGVTASVWICPYTILPSSCLVAAVTWEMELVVRKAQQFQADPGNGPLTVSLCLIMFVHRFCNTLKAYYGDLHLWLSLLAPSAPKGRPHIILQLVCFVTGIPPSQGGRVILTIAAHFSKAVHFVALSKLPSARETPDLQVTHVFRLQTPCNSLRYSLRQRFTINFPTVERVLSSSVIWFPLQAAVFD